MTKRIFRSILCVAAAVLLANLVIVMGCLYDYFGSVQEAQLKTNCGLRLMRWRKTDRTI